jgi:NAD-dependent dihydropyrimidine dehydrogenase PreA subunit
MADSNRSYCQIMIGRAMTGLVGLPDILDAFAEEGISADAPGLGARLVAELRKHNYVPRPAVAQYEAALVREYREMKCISLHLEAQASGAARRQWRDPRKDLQSWYPTIFESRCDGCGECLEVCPRDVLGWDPDHTKVLVLEPYECAPGCELCARACTRDAIIMPARATLHQNADSQAAMPAECAGCTLDCNTCRL